MNPNPYRFFDDLDGYLAWAATQSQPGQLFCPRHWSPAPVEGRNGVGAAVSMMTIAHELMPPTVALGDAAVKNAWLDSLAEPVCCVIGDDRVAVMWLSWPPVIAPALQLARRARLAGDPMLAKPHRLHELARGDGDLYGHAMEESGAIVEKATGRPFDPCRVCAWSPTQEPR